uniref:PDZ domain-containing protein n=1 Tax=Phaeomonas parva TaxID=124430 RepID=A0A7S1U795_9STRA|mmetsp:Transcript_34762/g.109152  ORF Transcript_34762/g.109152 Transcript_34762/m.109152 type:complete len:215 (+) Transcript_34762:148-792(+)
MMFRGLGLALVLAGASAFTPAPRLATRMGRVALSATSEAPELDEAAMSKDGALEMPKALEFTRTKYFFGRVTVDLGPEFKPLDQVLDPSFSDDNSALATVQVPLPMGMVIEESATLEGKVEVVEVVEGSNAEKAGVQVGDVLRGCTAMAVNLAKAAEEDVAFNALAGATKPGLCRAFYIADGMPFDETMNALTSNAEQEGGPGFSNMVFERHFS